MAVQPVAVIDPASVAVVCVMALATPEVTVAMVFTPSPDAATLNAVAPPPLTGIFPLYD